MKLPIDVTISKEKLTNYLLELRIEDDKSKFLLQAGYEIELWKQLEEDLRTQILTQEATLIEQTTFGDVYEILGTLQGLNGRKLNVVTIWMTEYKTQKTKFITLFPDKEK
ncbi:MAG: hypothetical protein KGZ58_00165 [Ignavibacteriales bacterium]|nr:hypothetical protein [Ignavibacteriales bacterium]